MKELIYRKGLLLKVVSWENDADNYRTKEYSVDTIEEAQAIKRMCDTLFESYHSNEKAISNDAGMNYYEDRIIDFMSNDEYFKKYSEEEMPDLVQDYAYELMDGSEYYNYRVCESCTIYNVKENVYLETVEV